MVVSNEQVIMYCKSLVNNMLAWSAEEVYNYSGGHFLITVRLNGLSYYNEQTTECEI